MEPQLLACIALALLLFGLVSKRAARTPLSAPMLFVGLGWALGARGAGWLEAEHPLIHGLAELTLVLVLFTDAARIDLRRLRREESLPVRMLVVGMPLTIGLGTALALLVFPSLSPAQALLLAAVLCPTDAALGQAVVSSPLVPVRMRQCLNVESGLNDGIALPVVLIAASLAGTGPQAGPVYWLRFAALQLFLGPLVGVAVGYAGGRLLDAASRAGWINEAFTHLSVLALAGLAFASAQLVGGNGFIASFVAGLVLGNVARHLCGRLIGFGEAEGQLLTLLVFMMFAGTMLPAALPHWDGRAWLYALLSLTAVRMIPISLSVIGTGLRPASHLFLGWFGPRGLASIIFALLVIQGADAGAAQRLVPIVTLTVLLSIFAHGTTAYPAARRYGSQMEAAGAAAAAERSPAHEHPVRIRHSYGA